MSDLVRANTLPTRLNDIANSAFNGDVKKLNDEYGADIQNVKEGALNSLAKTKLAQSMPVINEMGAKLLDKAESATTRNLTNIFSYIQNKLEGIIDKIATKIENGVKKLLAKLPPQVATTLENLFNKIKAALKPVVAKIRQSFVPALLSLASTAMAIFPPAAAIVAGVAAVGSAVIDRLKGRDAEKAAAQEQTQTEIQEKAVQEETQTEGTKEQEKVQEEAAEEASIKESTADDITKQIINENEGGKRHVDIGKGDVIPDGLIVEEEDEEGVKIGGDTQDGMLYIGA